MNSNADVQLDENDSLIDKETSPYIWVAEYLKNEAGQSVYSCISNYASCAQVELLTTFVILVYFGHYTTNTCPLY